MAVQEFEEHIKNCRKTFREGLENNPDCKIDNFGTMLKLFIDECSSACEEEILIENLKEEFESYMKSISWGE